MTNICSDVSVNDLISVLKKVYSFMDMLMEAGYSCDEAAVIACAFIVS